MLFIDKRLNVLASILLLTACGGGNGDGDGGATNTAPTVSNLTAASNPTDRGVPVTVSWSVADADGDTLTCGLDIDGDSNDDYSISDCANTTSQAHTFPLAGSYSVQLSVNDGNGGTAQERVSVTANAVDLWTWASGSKTVNQSGVYGEKGTADAANFPGARSYLASTKDDDGNFWIFGGSGIDSSGTGGNLNDLWRWDGNNWTWISGSNTVGQTDVYGAQGTPHADNVPGARQKPAMWADDNGHIWLFGGAGVSGWHNDLWRWDGSQWTWISGSNTVDQSGIYGMKGMANSDNIPGSRVYAASWTDSSGNVWIFGGSGADSVGTGGSLNDLWRWDGSNWTWISGSKLANQQGNYGSQGTADAANIPGGRQYVAGVADANDQFWIFSGRGYDSAGTLGNLNDLWRWDGSSWTWMSGSNIVNQPGVYGSKGTANTANTPGSRDSHPIMWVDGNNDLWMFGGIAFDKDGNVDVINDLWRWNGSEWTWVSGSSTISQAGVYGIKGTADAANVPGAREAAVGWHEDNGDLWLFGGLGYDSASTYDSLNGFWRYQP